jgi:hypothetical protein
MSIRFANDVLEARTADGRQLTGPVVNEHLVRAAVGITIAIGIVAFALAYFEHRYWFRNSVLAAAGRGLILLRRISRARERRRDLAQPGRPAGRLDDPAAAAGVGVGQAQALRLDARPGADRLHGDHHQRRHPGLAAPVDLPGAYHLDVAGGGARTVPGLRDPRAAGPACTPPDRSPCHKTRPRLPGNHQHALLTRREDALLIQRKRKGK